MRKSVAGVALAVLAVIAASGCGPQPLYPPADFRPAALGPAPGQQSVDTFIVVLDISPWMSDSYQKRLEAERAGEIIARINRTIPDMELRAGLIASAAATCFGCEGDRLLYGPEPYRREEFAAALSGMGDPGARVSRGLYGEAFRYTDLLATLGRVALFVVSDGENIFHGAGVKTAQKWKSALGERLCIYPILIGNDPAAFEVMRLLARVGGCGFAVNAEEIAAPESMAEYVRSVFLAGGGPGPLPAARPVGAEADADGDGIPDSRDRCPASPAGARVGPDGCWSPPPVAFEPGQAIIRDFATLTEVAAVLKANSDLAGEIHGHTDGTGSAAFNERLAQARAEALRDHLVSRGIAAERLRVLSFGETRPAAGNDTAAGRALNRRAEFIPARR